MVKTYAIYLPQFHETEFNNQHWGEGYTDWVAVKNARPLFKGHVQPKVPLGGYYDLNDVEVIRSQAKMAREYGISGFAIYQYYSVGNMQLETPVRLLLDNRDIDIDYFFYWANETWKANWFGNTEEVIWPQDYGDEHDWAKHFEYCLDYFLDDRYVKVNNMPLFIIYKPYEIPNFDGMAKCWNDLARDNGLDGVYFIASDPAFFPEGRSSNAVESEYYKAVYYRQPSNFNDMLNKRIVARLRWELTRRLLSKFGKGLVSYFPDYNSSNSVPDADALYPNKRTLLGAFTSFDNSPRREYRSVVYRNSSPDIFRHQFDRLMRYACEHDSVGILINAWNEWGEGCYLEPDAENGYAYLEAVRDVVNQYDH